MIRCEAACLLVLAWDPLTPSHTRTLGPRVALQIADDDNEALVAGVPIPAPNDPPATVHFNRVVTQGRAECMQAGVPSDSRSSTVVIAASAYQDLGLHMQARVSASEPCGPGFGPTIQACKHPSDGACSLRLGLRI